MFKGIIKMLKVYKNSKGYFVDEENATKEELNKERAKNEYFETEKEAQQLIDNLKKWGIVE
jgi:hypothetical protein